MEEKCWETRERLISEWDAKAKKNAKLAEDKFPQVLKLLKLLNNLGMSQISDKEHESGVAPSFIHSEMDIYSCHSGQPSVNLARIKKNDDNSYTVSIQYDSYHYEDYHILTRESKVNFEAGTKGLAKATERVLDQIVSEYYDSPLSHGFHDDEASIIKTFKHEILDNVFNDKPLSQALMNKVQEMKTNKENEEKEWQKRLKTKRKVEKRKSFWEKLGF